MAALMKYQWVTYVVRIGPRILVELNVTGSPSETAEVNGATLHNHGNAIRDVGRALDRITRKYYPEKKDTTQP